MVLADGTQLAQSAAIIRFLSSRHGLSGKGDVEAALVDAGFEHISDVRRNFFSAKSDVAKVAAFWESGLAASLAHLEKNVASDLYFAKSGQLTYTDIALYYLRFVLLTENADAVNKAFATTPKLLAIATAVEKEPKIAAYLAQRKQTPM
jgi:glutathione S-transferase